MTALQDMSLIANFLLPALPSTRRAVQRGPSRKRSARTGVVALRVEKGADIRDGHALRTTVGPVERKTKQPRL